MDYYELVESSMGIKVMSILTMSLLPRHWAQGGVRGIVIACTCLLSFVLVTPPVLTDSIIANHYHSLLTWYMALLLLL